MNNFQDTPRPYVYYPLTDTTGRFVPSLVPATPHPTSAGAPFPLAEQPWDLSAADSLQLTAQDILWIAVQWCDQQLAKAILEQGVDPSFVWGNLSPLALAAFNQDHRMVHLLLAHGADKHSALVLLQRCGQSAHGAMAALQTCLARHYHAPGLRADRVRAAIDALKSAFDYEFVRMRVIVAASCRARVLKLLTRAAAVLQIESFAGLNDVARCIPGAAEAKHAWSSGFVRDPAAAWRKCLAVLRSLMHGQAPKALDDVLLFLALARAAPSQMPSMGYREMDHEFTMDLSRWQALFPDDSDQLRSFQQAVLMLFGVDITSQPASSDSKVPLDNALQLFQTTANQLLGRHVGSSLGGEALDDTTAFFTRYARCIPGPHDGGGTHAHELPISDSAIMQGLDTRLTLILAGVAFAVVLGFLLALREILHGSINPLGFTATGGVLLNAISNPWNGISKTTWLYHVTMRTLALLHQYLTLGDCPGACWEPLATSPASTRSGRSPYIVPNTPTPVPTPPVPTPHSSAADRTTSVQGGQLQPKNTVCPVCKKIYSSTSNLGKHVRAIHEEQRHECPGCSKIYARHDTMVRHARKKHNDVLDE